MIHFAAQWKSCYENYLPQISLPQCECIEEAIMLIGVGIALSSFVIAVLVQYVLFVQLGTLLCACILYLGAHYIRRYPQYRILVEQNAEQKKLLQKQSEHLETLHQENRDYEQLNIQHREHIEHLVQQSKLLSITDERLQARVDQLAKIESSLEETSQKYEEKQAQLACIIQEIQQERAQCLAIRNQIEQLLKQLLQEGTSQLLEQLLKQLLQEGASQLLEQLLQKGALQQKGPSDSMDPDGTS